MFYLSSASPPLNPAAHSPFRLFSVSPAPSCDLTPQQSQRSEQPSHFPLFPHPVNIAHTPTPANPFRSIVYFTALCPTGVGGLYHSHHVPSHSMPHPRPVRRWPITPLNATLTSPPVNIDSKQLMKSLNPLYATLTKKPGGAAAVSSALLTIHNSQQRV